jgi:putative spermidine/putrescine transport system permease protein
MSSADLAISGLPPSALMTGHRRRQRLALLCYLAPVTLFYVGFLVLPYLSLLELSFFKFSSAKLYIPQFTLENYVAVATDSFYLLLMLRTLGLGLLVTVITLLLGYPLALMIVRSTPRMKTFLIAVALSPLLINLVVRTYAWLVLLGDTGVINNWLKAIGLIDKPLPIGGNWVSVTIGLVHITLPLMVLSLVAVLENIDRRLAEAAESLGATDGRVMRKIIFPLSLPGIGSGSLLVFCFTISAFVTPALLGGNRVSTVSTMIYQKFTFSANWPVGATLVFVLLAMNVAVIALHGRVFREERGHV